MPTIKSILLPIVFNIAIRTKFLHKQTYLKWRTANSYAPNRSLLDSLPVHTIGASPVPSPILRFPIHVLRRLRPRLRDGVNHCLTNS